MKRWWMPLAAALVLSACGGGSPAPAANGPVTAGPVVNPQGNPFPGTTPGLVLVDAALHKDVPWKEFVAKVSFGQAVYWTGEKKDVPQNGSFYKVKTKEGQEGYLHKLYIGFDMIPGVVVNKGNLYNSESLLDISKTEEIDALSVILVSTQTYKEGMKKISYADPKTKVVKYFEKFYPEKDLSTVEADWGAALFINAAKAETDAKIKEIHLKNALDKYPNTRFAAQIETLRGGGAPQPLDPSFGTFVVKASDGLTIRKTPDVGAEALGVLADGTIVYVNGKSEPATIGDKTEPWYKLQDRDGWVFGGFLAPYGP